jgi:hypothetical protein
VENRFCAKITLVKVNVFVTVLRPLRNDVVVVGLDPKSKKTWLLVTSTIVPWRLPLSEPGVPGGVSWLTVKTKVFPANVPPVVTVSEKLPRLTEVGGVICGAVPEKSIFAPPPGAVTEAPALPGPPNVPADENVNVIPEAMAEDAANPLTPNPMTANTAFFANLITFP